MADVLERQNCDHLYVFIIQAACIYLALLIHLNFNINTSAKVACIYTAKIIQPEFKKGISDVRVQKFKFILSAKEH